MEGWGDVGEVFEVEGEGEFYFLGEGGRKEGGRREGGGGRGGGSKGRSREKVNVF